MLIASGTFIAGYAGLLLGGRTILHGIANNSSSVDCSRNLYRRVRRVTARWATILHGITNNSLRVDCIKNQYRRVLLGGRTILSGIANSSPRVDSFRNQYCQVHRVTTRWAYDFV